VAMKGAVQASYNERLFSGGIRGFVHNARFHWLSRSVAEMNCELSSVLEIGCYDGKAIDFLPSRPLKYKGFDANYENALELAAAKWKECPNYEFSFATSAADLRLSVDERFDVAIAMETLEHIAPDLVEPYLAKIAHHLRGYFFVTVPNEKGPVFLLKWLIKRFVLRDRNVYSVSDVINHTFGRLHKVPRDEHKGFDYEKLVTHVARHFDIVSVSAIPLGFMPPYLSYGAGIIARSKRRL
jgi:2-polyprenyl-3-methyl-5-hydroxy-6-metoxy-1,4-benzoquinol methylase